MGHLQQTFSGSKRSSGPLTWTLRPMRTSKALRVWALACFCLMAGMFIAVPQIAPGNGWNHALLVVARAVSLWHQPSNTAHGVAAPPRQVGALLYDDQSGAHFCTASVVDSPQRNMIATAAHCVQNGSEQQDLVFAPAYSHGNAPFGVWEPQSVIVDQRWIDSANPNLDVAFIIMRPQRGENIGDVLGSHRLVTEQPGQLPVRVTGYPNNDDGPITCHNDTTPHGPTQRRFACDGYAAGTSGSPWISDNAPGADSGALIGLIGGDEQGGNEDDVSYSPIFGSDVQQLYEQAMARS